MHQVLVYGDSLTWGIIPGTRNRLPFHERWPGVLESQLNASGTPVRIIEDCLNDAAPFGKIPSSPDAMASSASASASKSTHPCRSSS